MDRRTATEILAGIPMPAFLVGPGERVTVENPASHALFGGSVEGKPVATFLRHPTFLTALESVLSSRAASRVRIALPSRGAGELAVLVHIAPVNETDGRTGALVTFEDLTALERAETMRRDFVANVSHELRTPLTALVGFIETLRGAAREDPAARDRFLGIMEREAGRMIRLVSDLLSLSKVEADERLRPSEPTDVVGVVKSVLLTLKPQAEAAGMEFVLDAPPEGFTVPGDQDQLLQVFHNLVENALKYAQKGKRVEVRVSRLEREPVLRGSAVRIEVVDHGEGIDPIHLPRLTERFYRVDAHRSREKGGTGLGLAIVKHIVNRHRGRLRIESEPGKGSKFSVLLPES
jgi:two-component system phosphate regulon sensor histidine kinase PhoR